MTVKIKRKTTFITNVKSAVYFKPVQRLCSSFRIQPIQVPSKCFFQMALLSIRKSSFNMTRGDEDIEGGLRKFLDTRKGSSEKNFGPRRGDPKICILHNRHI